MQPEPLTDPPHDPAVRWLWEYADSIGCDVVVDHERPLGPVYRLVPRDTDLPESPVTRRAGSVSDRAIALLLGFVAVLFVASLVMFIATPG